MRVAFRRSQAEDRPTSRKESGQQAGGPSFFLKRRKGRPSVPARASAASRSRNVGQPFGYLEALALRGGKGPGQVSPGRGQGVHGPDANRAVGAAGEQGGAVGAEGGRSHGAAMAGERQPFPAGV